MSQPILSVRDSGGNWIPIPAIQGEPGPDGISPAVEVADIAGGHRITITDANGPHSYDVMDSTEADSGWIQPRESFPVYYRRIGQRVSVRLDQGSGAYMTGDAAVSALTLPEGYRPAADRYFVCYSEYNGVELPLIFQVSASTGEVKVKRAPWAEFDASAVYQAQYCEFSFLAK